ncbi:hypothetical protein ABZX95_47710 [Streptomyces sp. NPDC004232]|nr:hypothetical protein [Streptomyces sp. tea 10]
MVLVVVLVVVAQDPCPSPEADGASFGREAEGGDGRRGLVIAAART